MYRLRYQCLAQYAQRFCGSVNVIAGDTDSFFLEMRNISVPNQLLPAMLEDGVLDSSNYPCDHSLYSINGKAELGRVKNECAGVAI